VEAELRGLAYVPRGDWVLAPRSPARRRLGQHQRTTCLGYGDPRIHNAAHFYIELFSEPRGRARVRLPRVDQRGEGIPFDRLAFERGSFVDVIVGSATIIGGNNTVHVWARTYEIQGNDGP
jgi:hypothetical protein